MAIRSRLQRAPRCALTSKSYAPIHPFDQQHGVDTSGLLFPEDLASGKQEDLFNEGYFGVAPSVFHQILEQLALDYKKFTFVDLGSGKGRALLLASEYPFSAIVGVELSPALHAVAVANIALYRTEPRQCGNISTIEADAARFMFPAGPLLIYLWNPFGLPVFTQVIRNLEISLEHEPRETYLVYIQPDLENVLQGGDGWRQVWRAEFALSEEDYAAHAFPPRVELCSVYRAVTRWPIANQDPVVA